MVPTARDSVRMATQQSCVGYFCLCRTWGYIFLIQPSVSTAPYRRLNHLSFGADVKDELEDVACSVGSKVLRTQNCMLRNRISII